jgi:hypothetical protein
MGVAGPRAVTEGGRVTTGVAENARRRTTGTTITAARSRRRVCFMGVPETEKVKMLTVPFSQDSGTGRKAPAAVGSGQWVGADGVLDSRVCGWLPTCICRGGCKERILI